MIKLGLLCANAQRKQQNNKCDVDEMTKCHPYKGFKAINVGSVDFVFGSIIQKDKKNIISYQVQTCKKLCDHKITKIKVGYYLLKLSLK